MLSHVFFRALPVNSAGKNTDGHGILHVAFNLQLLDSRRNEIVFNFTIDSSSQGATLLLSCQIHLWRNRTYVEQSPQIGRSVPGKAQDRQCFGLHLTTGQERPTGATLLGHEKVKGIDKCSSTPDNTVRCLNVHYIWLFSTYSMSTVIVYFAQNSETLPAKLYVLCLHEMQ